MTHQELARMRSHSTVRTLIAAMLQVVLITGCQHACSHLKLCHRKQAAAAPRLSAFVGGLVHHPTHVNLSAGPVTLGQSLEMAGGAVKSAPVTQQLDGLVLFHQAADAYLRQLKQIEDFATSQEAALKSAANDGSLSELPLDTVLEQLLNHRSPLDQLRKQIELSTSTGDSSLFVRNLDQHHNQLKDALNELSASISDLQESSEAGEKTGRLLKTTENIRALKTVIEETRTFVAEHREGTLNSVPAPMGYLIDNSTEWLMVCLRRNAVRQYYLYEIAVRGEAAVIKLEPQDFVSVVRIQDTALANDRSIVEGSVVLTGWTSMAGELPAATLRHVSQIAGPENPDVPSERLRIQIRRRSIGESEDSVFVLPFECRDKWPVSHFQLHAGDEVQVCPDIQSPLVMEQMIGAIVASGLAEQIEIASTRTPTVSRLDRASLWIRQQRAAMHAHFEQQRSP